MLPYITRRILASIPVLIVLASLTFFLLRLVPGDPATLIAGHEATPEEYQFVKENLGLDKPVHMQLWTWVSNMAQGDFGKSLRSGLPVFGLIKGRLERTLSLTVTTQLLAMLIAIPLGVIAAWKANTIIDRLIMLFCAIAFSVPVFWLGYIFIWLFGLWAFGRDEAILPVATFVPIGEDPWEFLRHMILPVVSLGLLVLAGIARMTRASVLEVLKEDYIRTARAKGLSERIVLIRHALRNASLPIITIIGLGLAGLLSGAVVTENVYAIPGLGRMAAEAISTRDYPIIQGLIILIGAAYVYINLIIDIAYAFLDTRIRY